MVTRKRGKYKKGKDSEPKFVKGTYISAGSTSESVKRRVSKVQYSKVGDNILLSPPKVTSLKYARRWARITPPMPRLR